MRGNLAAELVRARDGRAAGEALADVDRRSPRRRGPCRRGAAPRRTARPRRPSRAGTARARPGRHPSGRRRRSRARAAARDGGRARRAPTRRRAGRAPSRAQASRSTPSPCATSSSSPQIRPSRRSTEASIEFPDGIGSSSRSFVRATSTSPSRGERKKPPCSSSAKRSIATSAIRRASSSQRDVAGRDVELEQPVRDVRVVVEEAAAADATVADAAQHAAVLAAQRPEQERRRAPRRRRASRRARAGSRPRRAPRARGRSTMRSPCRRGTAAAARRAARAASLRRSVELAAHDRAAVLERLEQRLVEPELLPLLGRPGVRQPLDAVGVGVLRGREAAARRARSSRSR